MSAAACDSQRGQRILITGGAGFVATNLAHHLVRAGAKVRILDSLARAGSERNIRWLTQRFAEDVEFVHADVRDRNAVDAAVSGIDHIYHLAAQVAVTTSLVDPRTDFEVNALGTLNVLEAARSCARSALSAGAGPSAGPSLVFASTNKVYGVLPDIEVRASGKRYVPVNEQVRTAGIGEWRALDFHSPYGCSKGSAEQYVLDYSRSFGLRTVVLRMSCIYGPHQHGNEDQGWVAHFMRRALADQPITVYGDGLQVRDLLYVDDLVDAFERARSGIDVLRGRAFNIGGGPSNTVSILEVLDRIERLTGRPFRRGFDDWRVGDQRYYVSDIAGFRAATGWQPRVDVDAGLASLRDWLAAHASMPISPVARPAASAAAAAGARP